jgi:hypothetical protein
MYYRYIHYSKWFKSEVDTLNWLEESKSTATLVSFTLHLLKKLSINSINIDIVRLGFILHWQRVLSLAMYSGAMKKSGFVDRQCSGRTFSSIGH